MTRRICEPFWSRSPPQGGLVQHREALAVRRANLAALLSKLTEEERDTLATALRPLERLAEQAEN